MRPAFCTHCGAALGAQTRFCVNCGARVEEDSGATAASPAAQPTAPASSQATVVFTPPRQQAAGIEPPPSPAAPAYVAPAATDKGFSIGEMVKFGWRMVTGRFWASVGLTALGFFLYLVVYFGVF